MAVSQNQWTVLESYGGPLVTPEVAGVKILGGVLGGDVATVLTWVAEQFHARVDRLGEGCWGYNYRPIRGQSSGFSNHASGTAIDLNAPKFPMGARRMTAAQRAECRAIAAEAGCVRWGGDWTGSNVDEMHFEIQGGPAAVSAAAHRLRRTPAPTPTPTPEEGFMSALSAAEQRRLLDNTNAIVVALQVPGQPFFYPEATHNAVGHVITLLLGIKGGTAKVDTAALAGALKDSLGKAVVAELVKKLAA